MKERCFRHLDRFPLFKNNFRGVAICPVRIEQSIYPCNFTRSCYCCQFHYLDYCGSYCK
jgi:hypothetical protein